MITNLADILHELAQREAKLLGESPITHPTMIGTMYEGLTKDILERALPPGLDLRIVGGLVVDGHGGMSGQIDCMLVRGQGDPVPYSPGQFCWHVKDVLAVFEVKKTLFGAQLSDAFEHLRSVLASYSSWIQNQKGEDAVNVKASLRAYAEVTHQVAPRGDQWSKMPMEDFLLLQTMIGDQLAPLRIIFGYEGYATERGLRAGLLDFLEQKLNRMGYGPAQLPNLVVAKGGSLVKLSGHPYRSPRRPNGRWPIMASARVNPLLLVLELIWTRLSYEHNVTSLFGEDLEVESLAPLLDAEAKQGTGSPSGWGWMFYSHEFSEAQLAERKPTEPWSPVELDENQYVAINQLCARDIAVDEPEFVAWIEGLGTERKDFVAGLLATSLVAIDDGKLVLTTIQCGCMIMPDGRRMAGDDNTGRLTRWVAREMRRRAERSQGDAGAS